MRRKKRKEIYLEVKDAPHLGVGMFFGDTILQINVEPPSHCLENGFNKFSNQLTQY
jgi:hypothetical protein